MNSLNSVLLEGNLVRDPETHETAKGTTITEVVVASDRFYKKNEDYLKEVGYFYIEAWAKTAERLSELEKGQAIRVVGRLKQGRWTDIEGRNHERVKIVCEHIEAKPGFKAPDA